MLNLFDALLQLFRSVIDEWLLIFRDARRFFAGAWNVVDDDTLASPLW